MDLRDTSQSPRMFSSYGTKPYTPRLPHSVQGQRGRIQPLPVAMRPKLTTAGSVMSGTLTSLCGSGGATASAFSVVPFTQHLDKFALVLMDEDQRRVDPASRMQYANFVRDVCPMEERFVSPTLFADAVVKEAMCREGMTSSMKVAAATWALEIIAAQPGFEFLIGIRNLLLPALYLQFDETRLGSVNSAVKATLQETPHYVIHQNPFLSHALYAEDHLIREAEREHSQLVQGKLQKLGMSRKNAVQNLTEQLGRLRQAVAFRSWRELSKRKRFDRVSRENRIRRQDDTQRIYLLNSTFNVWKSTVERSRSVFLSERLHNAAAQLENAKNQFQLQCFRSDKHLFTVEELRHELADVRKQYEETVTQKREVERRLRDHDIETTNLLNQTSNSVLRELAYWRRFARRCVEGLSAHDETVRALEEQQRSIADYLSGSDDDDLSIAPQVSSASLQVTQIGGGKKSRMQSVVAGNQATPIASSPSVVLSATTRPIDMSNNSEAILLAWIRSVIAAAPVSCTVTEVSNFTTDLQNGEVMLLVLHHVFPGDVPLTPLQESVIAKRLERLVQMFVKCGVATVPRVSDFIDCNSDILFVVLAELFGRNLQLQSLRKAKELMEGSYTGLEDPISSKIDYTQEVLPAVLEDSRNELSGLIQQEATHRQQAGTLMKWQETVGRDAAFAIRERMGGNPVRAIGKSNVEKYWKFKISRYADLEQKYKVKDEGWKDHLNGTVRKILQKYVHTTSRLFFRYARTTVSMNEIHFWRLVMDFKLNEKPIGSNAVEKIFAGVAKPLPSNPDLADGQENVLLQEIPPADFVEILVRLSDAKYTSKSLPERVEQLLQAIQRTSANRVEPLGSLNLLSDVTVKVLDRVLVDLARIFLFFAKRNSKVLFPVRLLSAAISIDAVQDMMDDIGGVRNPDGTHPVHAHPNHPPFLFASELKSVIRNAVAVPPTEDGHQPQPNEVGFTQFLEILTALCVYKTPDPTVSMERKLEVLLSFFVARMRSKYRANGLVVADVRILSI